MLTVERMSCVSLLSQADCLFLTQAATAFATTYEARQRSDNPCEKGRILNNYSPGSNNLQVVLDTLVVDELALLKVAHLDLSVSNAALDSSHRPGGHSGRASHSSKERRGDKTGGHHVGSSFRLRCKVLDNQTVCQRSLVLLRWIEKQKQKHTCRR